MWRRLMLMASLAFPFAGASEEASWKPMSGVEIEQALSERTLKYATAKQTFFASGKTLYDSGRPSWGY